MCERERRSVAGLLMFGHVISMNMRCKTIFRHPMVMFSQAKMPRCPTLKEFDAPQNSQQFRALGI